jgi:hypothetical protein
MDSAKVKEKKVFSPEASIFQGTKAELKAGLAVNFERKWFHFKNITNNRLRHGRV